MKALEQLFENFLWSSRLVVLTAVISSLLASLAMFYMATVDAFYMISHLVHYADPLMEAAARTALHAETVTHIVEIVDGYLLATVLLIFALGLYELFISEIDAAEGAATSSSVLLIKSLDDLKARLAKVILMILIVKFFEHTVSMHFGTPLDLLYMAGGIALIGLALYLSHAGDEKGH
ncbi:MAG: YqhA family protein [Gammaproteobacteria bacterium]|uniref:YqhA family protein n=1 Tax=Candidatus Thiopontia autotrophica TaxID=2841688 RepID=A0A8J6P0L9_9GAMM|nr:YqhA family protein [Candidatus Thiopontia autotrophica]MBL6968957.1 YqhA family protein [Gammaproteobacteria bacterium]